MKSTILAILSFCLLSSTLFAQEYIPMFQIGNKWNTIEIGYPGPITSYRERSVIGTEIINGKTYYIVEYMMSCRMREENGIVYAYSPSDETEIILFDFTLEVGDTLPVDSAENECDNNGGYFDGFGYFMEVTEVSEQFIAGANRKVIVFDFMGDPAATTWIEGIGSLNGVWPKHFTQIESFLELTCFTTNGVTYFMNDHTECEDLATTEFEKDTFAIVPNTITDNAQFIMPENTTADTLKVFDMQGKLIKEFAITSTQFTIKGNDFTTGLYLYQITNNDAVIAVGKFIIQ